MPESVCGRAAKPVNEKCFWIIVCCALSFSTLSIYEHKQNKGFILFSNSSFDVFVHLKNFQWDRKFFHSQTRWKSAFLNFFGDHLVIKWLEKLVFRLLALPYEILKLFKLLYWHATSKYDHYYYKCPPVQLLQRIQPSYRS